MFAQTHPELAQRLQTGGALRPQEAADAIETFDRHYASVHGKYQQSFASVITLLVINSLLSAVCTLSLLQIILECIIFIPILERVWGRVFRWATLSKEDYGFYRKVQAQAKNATLGKDGGADTDEEDGL